MIKTKVTGISLGTHEVNIVTRESKKRGLYNFSAMVRMIIREWDEFNSGQRVRITEAGRAAIEEAKQIKDK